MILDIENWVGEQRYSNKIKKLFTESVICYRTGAHRASLLFSYIGFLTIIKENLITSSPPEGFTEAEWENLLSAIRTNDLWEKSVYDALMRSEKPIFELSEDIKLQVKYWNDRKNDCTLYNNGIEGHHTLSFWSFIKNHVSKMTVEGGQASLLKKFNAHFDPIQTRPNKDYGYLVAQISASVLPKKYHEFFEKLEANIAGDRWWGGFEESANVYAKIFDVCDTSIQESLVKYLKKQKKDITFLSYYADKIDRFNYTDVEVRKLWMIGFKSDRIFRKQFNIYAELLRKKLIPEEEIEEANETLFKHFDQFRNYFIPEPTDIDTIKAHGFYQTVYNSAIVDKNIELGTWVDKKCDLIISFIHNEKLTVETVQSITNLLHSRNSSQELEKALKLTFTNFPKIKTKFYSIAEKNEVAIPMKIHVQSE